MNDKFDEFTKSLAQTVTRRVALKKFGVGLAGMALAAFGLTRHLDAARQVDTSDEGPFRGSCKVCPVFL